MKQLNYEKGQKGEALARRFLEKKGHTVLACNYKRKTGEIDLITRDRQTIVFTEVKLRTSTGYGLPSEAVTPAKQKRIVRTAMYYLAEYGLSSCDLRFDVIEVLKKDGSWYVRHLENAFAGN